MAGWRGGDKERLENDGKLWEMVLMGVNWCMRMARRQHRAAKGSNDLSQSTRLNQKEKPKPRQRNVCPVSGCWHPKALRYMKNRSHGSEFSLHHLSLL